jgi:hypothetical protein
VPLNHALADTYRQLGLPVQAAEAEARTHRAAHRA